MGRHSISKGERLRALHQALVETVGPNAELTLKEISSVIMPCFDIVSRKGVYNVLDAMDLLDMVHYDRERTEKEAACVTILPLEQSAWTSISEPQPAFGAIDAAQPA